MACNRFLLYIVVFLNPCNFSKTHVTVFPVFSFEQIFLCSTDIIHDFPANVNNPKGSFSSKIGAKTAQRARHRIGAVQESEDGVYVWRLP